MPSILDSRVDSSVLAIRVALVLALALATPLAACSRGGFGYFGTTEPKHGPDEAWTNLGSEPEYIDPGKASDSTGGELIHCRPSSWTAWLRTKTSTARR